LPGALFAVACWIGLSSLLQVFPAHLEVQ